MHPSSLFNDYDLSSYMFNSNNSSTPFHFNWFIQDSSYKRGGTAPTNAVRNSFNQMKNIRPGFDNTMYKFESRNSKDLASKVLKLNDIQKISKIYNSTNIKPEKFTRKKPTIQQFSSKNPGYSSRNSMNPYKKPTINERCLAISSSQSMRNIKISTENQIYFDKKKQQESYFLTNKHNLTKKPLQKTINQPIFAKKQEISPKMTSFECLLEKKEIFKEKTGVSEGNLSENKENPKKSFEKDEIIHTDASSEPEEDNEDEKFEKNTKKMFLTAEHFLLKNQENEYFQRKSSENFANFEKLEKSDKFVKNHEFSAGKKHELSAGKKQEFLTEKNNGLNDFSDKNSFEIGENCEAFYQEESSLEMEAKPQKTLQKSGLNRPKTSEGGRRRRIIGKEPLKKPLLIEEKELKKVDFEEEEEEIVLETTAITYIQELQNQRPPCRKKVQAFDLEMKFENFEGISMKNLEKNPMKNNENFEKKSMKNTDKNGFNRPPSRHKTPPKAIGLEIINDNKAFPIKNMYVECREKVQKEDSFNGIEIKKVNLSGFEEKNQKKSEKKEKFDEKEEKSEIFFEENFKKENKRNSHPFSAYNNNRNVRKIAVLSKNNDILSDKALKDNFMNNNFSKNNNMDIVINHNKSPSQNMVMNANVQVPFETSLGSDFLSLFANTNCEEIRKKAF